MNDALRMRRGQRRGQLPSDRNHVSQSATAPVAACVAEAVAVDILHHDERARTVLDDVVNGGDVGMADPRGRPCLANDPPPEIARRIRAGQQALQRHLARKARIIRQEYLSHPATAEPIDDDIRPDRAPREEVGELIMS